MQYKGPSRALTASKTVIFIAKRSNPYLTQDGRNYPVQIMKGEPA